MDCKFKPGDKIKFKNLFKIYGIPRDIKFYYSNKIVTVKEVLYLDYAECYAIKIKEDVYKERGGITFYIDLFETEKVLSRYFESLL